MSSICALSLARSSGAAMAKNREMAALSLSLPLMLVAFVKIWSDEREIVVLWREREGQNGRKEGEEGKLWLEARHRIIIPVRLPVSPLFSLSHQQPGSPLFLGSGHHCFIQRGNHTTHDDGWWRKKMGRMR